jgi:large subunit ribosomal protein L29
MSAVKGKPRRLERYRAKIKTKTVQEFPGKGKRDARAARKVNIETAVARKKISGKAMREFESLGLDELKTKLADARKELFNLRFKHATGQLESVASLSSTRKTIARILTLMTQKKEVGA